ncbi:MAG: hypothetical protein GX890_05250 [Firmicutes bacterium]|jgi:hypothetical protein|nr:hypothetical protein [Bacillota bacterium]HPU01282.1 NTF2-like N-terminal transpeptidase domain-containing protein [Bacillota bacterium]
MKRRLPGAAGLILFLLLFFCGCSLLELGPQSSPEKLMETYLEALKNDDLETMLRLAAEPEENEEELAFLQKFIEMMEVESYSIDRVDYLSKSEAAVTISLSLRLMEQEKALTDSVKVVQKGGKWYLRERLLEE